jgi:hypothetical protein
MSVGSVLAETGQHGKDLPLPPWAIGITVFALLVTALLVTLTFGKDR